MKRAQAEYAVLDALVLGDDVVTVAQLAAQTKLSTEAVREALLRLNTRGLATAPEQGAGWVATDCGRGAWASHPERRPQTRTGDAFAE